MKIKETDCKYTYWEESIKMFYKKQEWERKDSKKIKENEGKQHGFANKEEYQI